VSGGNHRWFKGSTGKKRPVTRDDDDDDYHHHHHHHLDHYYIITISLNLTK
jgi:hypothetical protein